MKSVRNGTTKTPNLVTKVAPVKIQKVLGKAFKLLRRGIMEKSSSVEIKNPLT
jgi:hypothetical protein